MVVAVITNTYNIVQILFLFFMNCDDKKLMMDFCEI